MKLLLLSLWFTLPVFAAGISEEVSKLEHTVQLVNPTSVELEKSYQTIFKEVMALNPQNYTKVDLIQNGRTELNRLFRIRLMIRQQLAVAHDHSLLTEAVTVSARDALRGIRGVEDYIGFFLQSRGYIVDVAAPRITIARFPTDTWLNPSFDGTQLKSGDILISRGNAISSAAIARLADVDTQFSHMAFVYIDPVTKQIYTIESHTELGNVTAPFSKYFKDGKARSAIYRFADEKTAARAAEIMYKKVSRAEVKGTRIPYDFAMNPNTESALFCSEVVREGFALATQEQLQVPLYMSKLSMKNRALLEKLGATVTETFMPADIDGDPRFQLVGEWRDFKQIQKMWIEDAILTKMYEWMEFNGYVLEDSTWIDVKATLTYILRRTPGIQKYLKDKLPLNMDRSILATVFTLESVVSEIEKKVYAVNDYQLEKTGFPLSITQTYAVMERLRTKNPIIHSHFYPQNSPPGCLDFLH